MDVFLFTHMFMTMRAKHPWREWFLFGACVFSQQSGRFKMHDFYSVQIDGIDMVGAVDGIFICVLQVLFILFYTHIHYHVLYCVQKSIWYFFFFFAIFIRVDRNEYACFHQQVKMRIYFSERELKKKKFYLKFFKLCVLNIEKWDFEANWADQLSNKAYSE